MGCSQINVKDNVYAPDNNLPRQLVSDYWFPDRKIRSKRKKQNYTSRGSYTSNGLASKKTYNLNNIVSKVEKLSGLNKDYCLFITDIFNIGNKRINQYTITANTKAMSSTKFLTAKTIITEDLDFNNKIFNLNQFVLQSASSYREHSLLREIKSKQHRLFKILNSGAY